jgi:asparagine synthase (glutamine-hydrolysing)
MCGITGFWLNRPLRDDDGVHLRRMLHTLHHRGPDGHGVHLDRERGLAMGHTRLSIIDLETGDQPLLSTDERRVLTTNGEFYDYKVIRTRLICDGARFVSKTDSEIALHLYERFGFDFVEHLRGEFAVALFDAERERLVLVRDRFGIKPLYLHVDAGGVRWGSELKAILAHPGVRARLDRRAVLHQMMQTMVPGTTAFEGIEAVLPGHMVIVTRDGDGFSVRHQRYWDAVFPHATEHDDAADPAPFVDGVRERLMDAVRARLEADVPVGCYLSGGIDSCSILGLATAMQQSHVKAFTIGFDDADYDEARIAAEMAVRTQADQVLLGIGPGLLYGAYYPRTVWHAERTFYNTLGVAKWHMSRKVHECGYKVVVTGEGSDELFAGYPMFKRDFLMHATSAAERDAALRELERSNAVFAGAILAESTVDHPALRDVIGFTPAWIQPWILTLQRVRPLLSAALRDELADYDPIAAIAESLDVSRLRGRHPLDRAQYSWIKTMLEGQILTWGGDRVDMANSMESRPAFLDHHLAEYAFRIPPALRIRGGVEKWVLREAMRHVLPKVLYERPKFAFMAPPAHTDPAKRAAVAALVERHLSPDVVREAGLFDPAAVQAFLAGLAHADDRADASRSDIVLNHLLCLQLLHRQFVAGEGPVRVED